MHFAKEMGSTDESFTHTDYEPKDHFLTEMYVEFNQESMIEQQIPEQRFLEDVDYDDAAIGEMLFKAHREQDCHSEGLSVGQSSSSMSDGTEQPVVEIVDGNLVGVHPSLSRVCRVRHDHLGPRYRVSLHV